MNPTTTFFIDLLVLLGGAILAGELARRAGLPALVGQLLVGVLLGPTVLGSAFGLNGLTPELTAIQLLGTVLILFIAGLDTPPEQILQMGPGTVAMGAIPFALLSLLVHALLPGQPGLIPLFIALVLSVTALPVMGIMLAELRITSTPVGRLLINLSVVNELAAVTVFAALLQLQNGGTGSADGIGIAALSVGLFLAAVVAVYRVTRQLNSHPAWRRLREQLARTMRTQEAGFAILMVALVGASLFSQYLGLTYVVGAFFAGILVSGGAFGSPGRPRSSVVFTTMTWGFFVPLFFAFVGVEMDLWSLSSPLFLVIFGAIAVAAVTVKVASGYAIGRLNDWSGSDAFAIGSLVSSRGGVSLAMAVILLGEGILTSQTFTLVAAVGLVTTIIAPLGATWAWRTSGRTSRGAMPAPVDADAFDTAGVLSPDPSGGDPPGLDPGAGMPPEAHGGRTPSADVGTGAAPPTPR